MQLTYHFSDPALNMLALTHRSAGNPNNERLEFLGDALLDAFVAELLYKAYPKASEGELSRLRAQLVNGRALAVIARKLKLGERLKLGAGELKNGGLDRDSILAGALEALLAAIYLDGGIMACGAAVHELFAHQIQLLTHASKDAKTRLQEWLQGYGLLLPNYTLKNSYGKDHARVFEVSCTIAEPLKITTESRDSSVRGAEQKAAALLLARLQVAFDQESNLPL